MPWREAAAWLDHHALPCAGGLRDQPLLLWMAVEAVASGIRGERNDRQRDQEEAFLARLSAR